MNAMAEPHEKPRNATPLQVAKAVFWSFLGIRKRAAHERDAVTLKPAQVIVAGHHRRGYFRSESRRAGAIHHPLNEQGTRNVRDTRETAS